VTVAEYLSIGVEGFNGKSVLSQVTGR
jgi:hypothetical protein